MLIEALIADLAPVTEVKINKKTQSKREQEEAKQYNKIIKESMVAGLMVDDVKAIMAAYPDITDVYAVMCEEVAGQLPQGLNIMPVNKDRI